MVGLKRAQQGRDDKGEKSKKEWDRVRCGKRQERGLEGQENEWKSAARWSGNGRESLGNPRDLGYGRLPGVNVDDPNQNA